MVIGLSKADLNRVLEKTVMGGKREAAVTTVGQHIRCKKEKGAEK
jgi:hypothetical protein